MEQPADPFNGKLFSKFPDDALYPSKATLQAHLLDQYKLYVEMADRVSTRRQAVSSYFMAINTTLFGFVGYVLTKDSNKYLWLLGFMGMALSYLWYRIIVSHQDLNLAKFKVVHEIEKRLPLRLYSAEWEVAGCGKNPALYTPLTHIEQHVPWVFFGLYALVVMWYVCKLLTTT